MSDPLEIARCLFLLWLGSRLPGFWRDYREAWRSAASGSPHPPAAGKG